MNPILILFAFQGSGSGTVSLIIGALIIIGTILILRMIGAWMLRINDVISELKIIKEILRARLTDQEREEVKKRLGLK